MSEFQVVYVPIGVPTFHLESAQAEFEKSIALLKSIEPAVVVPDEMLLSMDLLCEFLEGRQPDLIVLSNVTFANAAYAGEVLHRFDCPILLWTLREPVIDGGRLRLNSLTGAYSAANAISAFRGERFSYVFGSATEEKVVQKVSAAVAAARLCYQMKHLKMASIGHTPQGFGFGRALDLELLQTFGVTLESIEARELIDMAKGYSNEEAAEYFADAKKRICGLDAIPEQNVLDFARLYKAYREYVTKNGIGAISSRCWPDFFTAYGTPVCAVLGILNDLNVAASCEADTYGALSMYMGMQLSGRPVFFGDPVSMDETENTITYWHCGMAACSLAEGNTGAQAGLHCNRKIGPTLDFGCRGNDTATVFRVGRKPDGTFRFFVLSGKILDKPKQFTGTSLVVQCRSEVSGVIEQSVKAGWEPHFAVIYGDCRKELYCLSEFLGIELCEY